jgi:hypothetical protein
MEVKPIIFDLDCAVDGFQFQAAFAQNFAYGNPIHQRVNMFFAFFRGRLLRITVGKHGEPALTKPTIGTWCRRGVFRVFP